MSAAPLAVEGFVAEEGRSPSDEGTEGKAPWSERLDPSAGSALRKGDDSFLRKVPRGVDGAWLSMRSLAEIAEALPGGRVCTEYFALYIR